MTRLDRLARSTRDLLNTPDRLGKNGIESLRETVIDTTTVGCDQQGAPGAPGVTGQAISE
jgi:hypothetical protein